MRPVFVLRENARNAIALSVTSNVSGSTDTFFKRSMFRDDLNDLFEKIFRL